jgi:hypothetical protein
MTDHGDGQGWHAPCRKTNAVACRRNAVVIESDSFSDLTSSPGWFQLLPPLAPESRVIVIDTHRPYHLENVSRRNIQVCHKTPTTPLRLWSSRAGTRPGSTPPPATSHATAESDSDRLRAAQGCGDAKGHHDRHTPQLSIDSEGSWS